MLCLNVVFLSSKQTSEEERITMADLSPFYKAYHYSTPFVRMHQNVIMRIIIYITLTIWGVQVSNGFIECDQFQDGKNQLFIKLSCLLKYGRATYTIVDEETPTEKSYR